MDLKIEIPSYVIFKDTKQLKAVLRSAGAEIARIAKSLIKNQTKRGKSSIPGGPPNSRTGALASSIKVSASRDGESVSIRDVQYYSRFLETGARGGGGQKGNRNQRSRRSTEVTPSSVRVMEPRPFITTAYKQIEPTLKPRIIQSIMDDIKFRKTK